MLLYCSTTDWPHNLVQVEFKFICWSKKLDYKITETTLSWAALLLIGLPK